ncbi:MAG: hypothetical protein ACI4XI_03175 [Ruminococcus sp.]
MTEKYIMSKNRIPDGILHDQNLYCVTLDGDVLTLSFKTHFFSDYAGNEFCEKYKDFTKCHIKCKLEDKMFCEAELKTTCNESNAYNVKIISIAEFANLASAQLNEQTVNLWEYLDTYVSPNIRGAIINLSICLNYKGTEYSMCGLELNTNEIEFVWE